MRLPAIVALGVLAYAVVLVALMPARFVAAHLPPEMRAHVTLLEPDGTLWNGRARAIVTSAVGAVAVDRLEWRLRPERLLALRVAFDVTAALPGIDATLELGRSPTAWEARELHAGGDIAALSALVPWIAPWRPEGTFTAVASSASWDASSARGAARVEWKRAAVALSSVRPLGSYAVELRADSGPAKVVVTTLAGPLRIAAQGTLTPPGRFEASGEARAEGPDAAALEPLLDLLGPKRADGSRALAWRTP